MTRLRQTLGFLNVAVKRSFSTVQNELTKGRVAFIVGAGADIIIASDFCKNQQHIPPNWTELICELAPFPGIRSRTSKAQVMGIARNWPAEAASIARWWSGDRVFQNSIQKRLDQPKIIEAIKKGIPEGTSSYELCRLLIQSNLIITPNYSSYLVHALRSFVPRKDIAVIDREDLPSLPFPESEKDPHTIFVIHLHGRCSARSFPILDAWGYNILQHDDQHYVELLRNLFTNRSVVTVGVSWSDPPLRSAAAFVQRTRPYMIKRHLALYFLSAAEKQTFGNTTSRPIAPGTARLWSNAMRAAYGVDVLFVDRTTQPSVLQRLGDDSAAGRQEWEIGQFKQELYNAENDPEKLIAVWEQIANFLDDCGDYESPLQHRFLRMFSGVGSPTSEAVAEATLELANKLLNFVGSAGTKQFDGRRWGIAARVERHLRHHLYLYRPKRQSDIRSALWLLLWNRLPAFEWTKLSARLRFDFLLGKFELKLPHVNLSRRQHDLRGFAGRFSKAPRIWNYGPGPLPKNLLKDRAEQQRMSVAMQKLSVELLDLGWESLAAKVLCDQMHFLATIASKSDIKPDDPRAKVTVEQAIQASRLSRSAGCFRRQVKADSIAAMWTPDPLEGRIQLLGNIRASDESKSVEPGLLGGLGAALLVCDLRARIRAGQPIKQLHTLANELFDEAGLDRAYIYDALKYWIPFTPKQVTRHLLSLAKELKVRFV